MIVNAPSPICEGILEKKSERRLRLGPVWKRKYCMLSTEALAVYRSKSKANDGSCPLRTVPLCHMKSVDRQTVEGDSKMNYFSVETEQGETLTFRCKDGTGWAAQIQIQLIRYKNRQDILRYKQLNTSMAAAESAIQRCKATAAAQRLTRNGREVMLNPKTTRSICPTKGYKTIVLPNHKTSGMGIGITVIPADGKVVVNRILEDGPAARLHVLQPRDEIVIANGQPVTGVEMLSEIVRQSPNAVTLIVKPYVHKIPSPVPDYKLTKNIDYIMPEKPPSIYNKCIEKSTDDCHFKFT